MILVALLVIGVASDEPWGQFVSVCVLGGILLFTLRTSRASRRLMRLALLLAAAGAATSLLTTLGRPTGPAGAAGRVAMTLLLASIPAVIGRRLIQRPQVTGSTIAGALCVYLLLGLLFASVFGLAGSLGGQFFAQQKRASVVDYLYFSYITLTTVGYGDLTPNGNVDRMLAVTEALTGQLYLVTVVAVVISNFRRRDR